MKSLLVIVLACGFFISSQAQSVYPTDRPLDDVAELVLPQQDNKALRTAELSERKSGRPPHFAVPLSVDITPQTHGTWETLANGDLLWRYQLSSPGAKSLNLGFSHYEMPAGAYLLLYSPDRETIMGPFSRADNEDHDQLWTPILMNDKMVIEVVTPASRQSDIRLHLTYVNHDFMGFGSRSASGSCNLDVICGSADGWGIVDPHRDIIQSAGMYTLNGIQTCSGALINNARNDCTPYYLTADHCGISNSNAASMVVYWNYENDPCRQPNSSASGQGGNGQLNEFNTGAIFRAGYSPSDFTLVELDDPLDAAHDPFLAGWSREFAVPTSMIGIHHPGTEEKRISFDNDPGIISGFGQPSDSTHVQVNDWDVGTTEGGSSGSPLFNQDERIVGQLTGGGAACGNNLEDQYGWVYVSWDGGGSPQSRLKDWLDPDNTGAMFIDGKSCAFSVIPFPLSANVCNTNLDSTTFEVAVSSGFAGNVTLTANNLPAGAVPSFSVNPVTPGDTAILTLSGLSGVAAGSYTFQVFGTDGTESDSSDLLLEIVSALPMATTLSSPANGTTGVSTFPQYSWASIQGANYSIEVATDSLFTNIVDNASGITSANYSGGGLQALTTYYWRVTSDNACGNGPLSSVFSFETANILCTNVAATNVPVSITAQMPVVVTSTLNINQTGGITDVNVIDVRGTHSWISDLSFTLISPAGTRVTLISGACQDEEDFYISWDDQSTGTPPCPYNDQGTYPPSGSLADFNGENPMGMWTLEVEDSEFFDGGSLNGWNLEICATGGPTAIENGLSPFAMSLYPNPSSGRVKVELSAPLAEAATVEVFSAEGKWVLSQTMAPNTQALQLDATELPAGLYLVKVETRGYSQTKRLIISQL